ncbi:uncharacterized protein EV154DRAFT_561419 [Mucor mucedo]|uniref:uncharacterized protein n=1 Tax=Mucor mucedo TaxID=29922 RepID=UPI002220D155|nr:uncharacterized protein EV154DRAFT_561419 [Mucor mucedo]KAI7893425.1 hypothetical protein EV154DRAFT_561419 [Mucor mucedo]
MTADEQYFEVYAFVLKKMKEAPMILNAASKEQFSEGDYVVKLWSRIFSAVFDDSEEGIFCKWGDTVSVGSNAHSILSWAHTDGNASAIGDKVDLWVCTSSPSGKTFDLINIKLAKDTSSTKFHANHRKWSIISKRHPWTAYSAMLGGGVAQGNNYVASHSGSLRLPSSQVDLWNLRMLLRRLYTIKSQVLGMKATVKTIEHREKAFKKSMEEKQNKTRSLTPQLCSNFQ